LRDKPALSSDRIRADAVPGESSGERDGRRPQGNDVCEGASLFGDCLVPVPKR
jgi:hypothetical protein